jgi:hypothetical protein
MIQAPKREEDLEISVWLPYHHTFTTSLLKGKGTLCHTNIQKLIVL